MVKHHILVYLHLFLLEEQSDLSGGWGSRWCALAFASPPEVLRFYASPMPLSSSLLCWLWEAGRTRTESFSCSRERRSCLCTRQTSCDDVRVRARYLSRASASWERPTHAKTRARTWSLGCRTMESVDMMSRGVYEFVFWSLFEYWCPSCNLKK